MFRWKQMYKGTLQMSPDIQDICCAMGQLATVTSLNSSVMQVCFRQICSVDFNRDAYQKMLVMCSFCFIWCKSEDTVLNVFFSLHAAWEQRSKLCPWYSPTGSWHPVSRLIIREDPSKSIESLRCVCKVYFTSHVWVKTFFVQSQQQLPLCLHITSAV